MFDDLKINPAPLRGASNHSPKIDFIDRAGERARYFKRCGIKLERESDLFLKIKVRPGAGETKTKGILRAENEDVIKIDIACAPEKDRANQELIRFLADEFEISKRNVKIVSGASDKFKLVRIIK